MAFDVKAYAALGAARRISEITQELVALRKAFPGLSVRRGGAAPTKGLAGGRRRRPPMTAAQKKAVSIRMKKYWASRRAAKAAK